MTEFSTMAKFVLGGMALIAIVAGGNIGKSSTKINAVAASSSSATPPLKLSVDSLTRDDWRVTAMAKVTNDTTTAFDTVFVHCAFFDGAKMAIQDSVGTVSGLRPNETAFASISVVDERSAIRSVNCRIDLTVPVRWP
jgi:hypothetical protein